MAARPPFIEKFLIVSFIPTDYIINEPRILWENKTKLPFLSRQGERGKGETRRDPEPAFSTSTDRLEESHRTTQGPVCPSAAPGLSFSFSRF